MGSRELSYRIDRENRIVAIDGDWDCFALENETRTLRSDRVLGKPLFDFITGSETRHLHEVLLARARSGVRLQRLPFRCDSPGMRRYMEMDIASPDGEQVEYRCRQLREEPRKPVPVAGGAPGAGRTMRMCSWCKKVHLTGALWVEVEEAVGRFGLLEDEVPPQVTHAVCSHCLDTLQGNGK